MFITIGKAALFGFGCLLLLLPLNGAVASCIGSRKTTMLKETDKRTNLISQILEGIEVIKSWSMENAFEKKVSEIRNQEMIHLKRIHCLRILLKCALFAAPTLVACLTLTIATVYFERPLNLIVSLKTLSYLNVLRFPLMLIPHALSLLFEARASLQRIQNFLMLPECPLLRKNGQNDLQDDQDEQEKDSNGNEIQRTATNDEEETVTTSIPATTATLSKQPCIVIKNASLAWNSNRTVATGVNVKIYPTELIGIVGPVGCGKTLLLQTILQELDTPKHTIQIHSTAAKQVSSNSRYVYFSQTPTIFNDTIRGNVLFGTVYNRERYEKVLYAACLNSDIQNMGNKGDMTMLGEKGVNLSGGQRARVSFARCLYNAIASPDTERHTIVLLDDPLAAVDVEVGINMWERGVLGLLSNTTVLVVLSSRIDELLLKNANNILVFDDKTKTTEYGTPMDMLCGYVKDDSKEIVELGEIGETEEAGRSFSNRSIDSIKEKEEKHEGKEEKLEETKPKQEVYKNEDQIDIIIDETRDVGKVRCSIWAWHLSLSCVGCCHISSESVSIVSQGNKYGGLLALLLGMVFSVSQSAKTFTDISLLWYGGGVYMTHINHTVFNSSSQLSSSSAANRNAALVPSFTDEWTVNEWTFFLYICVVSMFVLALFRSLFMMNIFLRSSKQLHQIILHRLLKGPLIWFQRRPHGRILNKLSSDLMKIDLMLPDTGSAFIENISALLAAFLLSVISVPFLIIVLLPAIVCLCVVVNLFRNTSREIVRLDGEARSPVYSAFGDVLNSRVTIRAYNVSEHWKKKTYQKIDQANAVSLLYKMLDRWNSMRLNGIMSVYASFLFFAAVVIQYNKNLQSVTTTGGDDEADISNGTGGGIYNPTVVGLALIYSLQLLGLSSWTAMSFVQTENALTSVERLQQLMQMPEEKPNKKKTDPVICDSTFPTGSLTVTNLNLRYRDGLPLALNNFNIHIEGGETIGIVGRTGAGKSSIFVALLRLTEPLKGSSIQIDGKETINMGLSILRRHLITLIPQNPVVFSGTIRFNLDPYFEHKDEKILNMLKDLKLNDTFVNERNGLNSYCGSNGSLLSHGQRQLLVVGRALLQKDSTKIYLLDEATSSMDDDTDDIVQKAIRKHAKGKTIIIVAHRLRTVLSCDRIAVMESGQIIQIGQPNIIAWEENSAFNKMMKTSGISVDDWPSKN